LIHLYFVDDLLLFSKATLQLVEKINKVLLAFGNLSDLKAYPSKSTLFYSRVSLRSKKILALDYFKVRYIFGFL